MAIYMIPLRGDSTAIQLYMFTSHSNWEHDRLKTLRFGRATITKPCGTWHTIKYNIEIVISYTHHLNDFDYDIAPIKIHHSRRFVNEFHLQMNRTHRDWTTP